MKRSNNVGMCDALLHVCKSVMCALFLFGAASCDDDDPVEPEPDPEPTSTFKIHIGEGNIVRWEELPDDYPPVYTANLVMEDLPADEKILYMGGCYSIGDTVPDISDCTLIYDISDFDTFQNWDWEAEPLIWWCMYFFHPLPGTTYYLRGYVQTDKGEYYSNTVAIRSSFTEPLAENPDAYEIPVVFHLFPDAEGNYPVKDWLIQEQLDYANHVYGNYYNVPGQAETGVRFVAATHTPDGTPLETPGIVHEKEAVEINDPAGQMFDSINDIIDDAYLWDMEYALNVWVCPIKNAEDLAGRTLSPFFDADERLEGCNTYEPGAFAGIFLNSNVQSQANNVQTFAHEAGHFLGLEHVFEPGGDYCDDTRWYDREVHLEYTQGAIDFIRMDGTTGETFWSDNVMDYDYSFMTGFTPDQVERIQYTLRHAYFIPGEAGKEEAPALRSAPQTRKFGKNPVR